MNTNRVAKIRSILDARRPMSERATDLEGLFGVILPRI